MLINILAAIICAIAMSFHIYIKSYAWASFLGFLALTNLLLFVTH